MTKEKTLITLPSAKEMLKRLIAADKDPHKIKNFYPRITKNEGIGLWPEGIVNMIILSMLMETGPCLIDAIVLDAAAAKECKAVYAEIAAEIRK